MSRLPKPGQDSGTWGEILNDYLGQSHTSEGTLKPGSVGASQLQDGSVSAQKLSGAVQASLAKADAAISSTTAHATFVKTVNGIDPDEDGNVIVSGEQGIQGTPGENGQDGASVTVTLVAAADWPPPSDSDPLHWYVKVP